MNDRDALIAICEHLGLVRVPAPTANRHPGLDDREFAADETRVFLGCGDGYGSFYAGFTFDAEGRAIRHAIGE